MSSHAKLKREKAILAEYETQVKELRTQLAEQLKCLDQQVEIRIQLMQDLSEFFRRKSEIELEYSRSLEKLSERFSSRIRNSKDHQNFRKEQNLLSPVNCWYVILNQTRQESKEHAALSEVYTNNMTVRLSHITEDISRLSKKSKDVGLILQDELLKVTSELQTAMRTYHLYHTDSVSSESKLKEAEKLEERHMGKSGDAGQSQPGTDSKQQRRSSMKKMERLKEKRQAKFQENKLKCTKARNDYLLNLAAANAAMNKYYLKDLSTLINCCDLGFHLSLGKTLKTYLSAENRVQKSRHDSLMVLETAVEHLDPDSDQKKIMEMNNSVFCLPFHFEYQPHEGDEVCEVNVEAQVRNEMVTRFQQLQSRLSSVTIETEEVNKTLKATMNALLESITCEEYCTPDICQTSQSTELLKMTGSEPPGSKPSLAKRRATQQETETYYFTKVKEFLTGSSLISKLQAKHDLLKESIDKAESTDNDSSRRRRRMSRTQSSGQQIPLVVESCIRFINLHGLHHEGIFRVPGSQTEVNEIRNAFERGEDPLTDSQINHDIDSVAGVLKLYFRGLEKPLFPMETFQELIDCVQIEKLERPSHLQKIVAVLPQTVLVVMRYLFAFLNHLSQYSDENMMDPYNLAVCFGPTLVSVPVEQDPVSVQAHVNEVVKTIIIYHEKIFPGAKELAGPVYEKCMTGEEDYSDSILPEPIAEEADAEMEGFAEPHASEDEMDNPEVVAQFDYTGRSPQELTFKKGDVLILHSKASDDWWRGELGGCKGLIPHKYISVPEAIAKKIELQNKKEESKAASIGNLPEEVGTETGGRMRVNSDSASLPRNRSGSSPSRKLTSPFIESNRLLIPVTHPIQGKFLLPRSQVDISDKGQERRSASDNAAGGFGASLGKHVISADRNMQDTSIAVDKEVTKQMNSVFKELLSLKQGKPEEVAESTPTKISGSSMGSDAKQSSTPKKPFGLRGRALFKSGTGPNPSGEQQD
ncbi:SLIT-ROBO Rho GTPase-activating protein 3 isoform X2 [Erpetoichthys calabaricus]|uniref:SLIT-ROBO Rho GTPase-activating protein 3 isoform X2 n=1 Tax=Erpetoichthys calabaricus TaxID=27687 RepID=UPI00223416B0|nr:SLIT-ROBO Rho GTPase-activating protein 3 isoform X2 [Erpetoichthys calabaricus]